MQILIGVSPEMPTIYMDVLYKKGWIIAKVMGKSSHHHYKVKSKSEFSVAAVKINQNIFVYKVKF